MINGIVYVDTSLFELFKISFFYFSPLLSRQTNLLLILSIINFHNDLIFNELLLSIFLKFYYLIKYSLSMIYRSFHAYIYDIFTILFKECLVDVSASSYWRLVNNYILSLISKNYFI